MYSDKILRRIRGKRRGWVFTPKDFIDIAPRNTVDKALSRLVQKGIIRKLNRGIYDFPVLSNELGAITPSPEQLATSVAKQTNDLVQQSGAAAVNQLGIDTQVPAKTLYYTSGQTKRRKIAGYNVQLKHSRFIKHFDKYPHLAQVVIALHHLGKNNINEKVIRRLSRALTTQDKKRLVSLIKKVPQWMVPCILKICGKQ